MLAYGVLRAGMMGPGFGNACGEYGLLGCWICWLQTFNGFIISLGNFESYTGSELLLTLLVMHFLPLVQGD